MTLNAQLVQRLVTALERVPGSANFNTRTFFLKDIPLAVRRDANQSRVDLLGVVLDLDSADPNSLPRLLDNAMFVAGGGAVHDELGALKAEVQAALQAPPVKGSQPVQSPVASSRPWDRESRKKLREALTALYDSHDRIRSVCNDVGIRTGNVNLAGPIRDVWFNVIEEASKHGLLDALYAYAKTDYPTDADLNAVRSP